MSLSAITNKNTMDQRARRAARVAGLQIRKNGHGYNLLRNGEMIAAGLSTYDVIAVCERETEKPRPMRMRRHKGAR